MIKKIIFLGSLILIFFNQFSNAQSIKISEFSFGGSIIPTETNDEMKLSRNEFLQLANKLGMKYLNKIDANQFAFRTYPILGLIKMQLTLDLPNKLAKQKLLQQVKILLNKLYGYQLSSTYYRNEKHRKSNEFDPRENGFNYQDSTYREYIGIRYTTNFASMQKGYILKGKISNKCNLSFGLQLGYSHSLRNEIIGRTNINSSLLNGSYSNTSTWARGGSGWKLISIDRYKHGSIAASHLFRVSVPFSLAYSLSKTSKISIFFEYEPGIMSFYNKDLENRNSYISELGMGFRVKLNS